MKVVNNLLKITGPLDLFMLVKDNSFELKNIDLQTKNEELKVKIEQLETIIRGLNKKLEVFTRKEEEEEEEIIQDPANPNVSDVDYVSDSSEKDSLLETLEELGQKSNSGLEESDQKSNSGIQEFNCERVVLPKDGNESSEKSVFILNQEEDHETVI